MLRTLRHALMLLAFALPLATDAATRYWAFQNVVFEGGATLVGSFGYDDALNQVTSWNVRVKGSDGFLPFTFVPGNSTPAYGGVGNTGGFVYFVRLTAMEGTNSIRELFVSMVHPLDGSVATQPLYLVDPVSGQRYFAREQSGGAYRYIAAGSVTLVPFPPPVGLVDVIEFYHAGFDHYVMSADPVEINALDTGYFTGWVRTGQQFRAYATGSSAGPSQNPVCRYYGLPSAGLDSHFYSAGARECWEVNEFFGAEWQIESDNVFQIDLPDPVTGACPGSTVPVYRVFNNRPDANHRYTTSTVVRAQMETAGWIREGYGPDATVMCAYP